MTNTFTRDVLRGLPAAIADALASANHPSGAPNGSDMKVLTEREQRALRPFMQSVAEDLRRDGVELTNRALAKEAKRRLEITLRAVAGRKDTADGRYLSKDEIGRIADPDARAMVQGIIELRAKLHNWQTKDPEVDGVHGASVERAYAEMPPARREIVVAVIDSGVDVHHEDLRGKIWTNPGEIPGNGIDDDGNGYVDDVHGWNFLGSVDERGEPVNLHATTLSATRELVRMKKLAKERKLTASERTYLRELSKEVEAGRQKGRAAHYYDASFDPRAKIIGDDPGDFSHRSYGNNDVVGPNARHGTHVAGIIAGNRHNGIGGDGVASAVKIMPVRAIPDGDEYSKDVANAVRYAVDNGAHIINMSFGKRYTAYPNELRAAFEYAVSKGVLLVHAAGNDAQNNDVTQRYPAAANPGEEPMGNWLDVGAAYAEHNARMAGGFSNHGQQSVDLFAPGVGIYASLPGNQYGSLNGTSMAAPVVSGVLAQLMAAYPEVAPERMREVVLETVRRYPDLKVWLPSKAGKRQRVDFSSLSKTGGVVDMLAAVRKLNQAS